MKRVKDFVLAGYHWIPVTSRGALLIATAVLAFRYLALQEHDRLVLAACVGFLVLFVVLAMTVLGVGLWLRFSQLSVPSSIDATEGVPRSSGLVLAFVASIPCIVIDIRWLNFAGIDVTLADHQDGSCETIMPGQRQQRSEVIRQFEISDIFALCCVRFRRGFPQTVRIEPMPAASCSITQVRRDQQGDDLVHPNGKPHGDLIEMRHYRAGDPLKLVLWKHYARTGHLLVRQPENSIASMSQTIACFVAGPGDQASAGVARTVVAELYQAGEDILFQADGSASATDCSFEAIEQIIQSADARQTGGGVMAAVGKVIRGNVVQHCIAFVPSQPGAWLDRMIAAKSTFHLQIDAIIGVDELSPPRQVVFLPRWAHRRSAVGAIEINDVLAVVERLSAAGINARVIHRRSGQPFSNLALKGMFK
jgi:hypothetical protein